MLTNNSITTIQDVLGLKEVNGLNLIAGKEGLHNQVEGCGLLDYEFDPELNDRYSFINYRRNLLIFSSLMYAKNQTWIVSDTIRSLIAMGTSGLIIRNVYNIHLPNTILRYADSKSYPIFILENKELYYETIVRSVYNAIKAKNDNQYRENIIDSILNIPLNEEEEKKRAFMLFPSLSRYYVTYFFRFLDPLSVEANEKINHIFRDYNDSNNNMITYYKDNMLLICSVSSPTIDTIKNECTPIIEKLSATLPPCALGRSKIHINPSEIRQAIEESIHASLVQQNSGEMFFGNIGTYEILFSAISLPQTRIFSDNILKPILDYDSETNGQLYMTLFEFEKNNGDLHTTSEKLGIHENTLRQRLSKISTLTGLDYHKANEYEQLALSIKIRNCINWSHRFGF